jgi:glycosyltransferase involved in cell wall biosynthesis
MPVYNGDRYLVEAIESILNQTFNDFELLIVDDGSRDRSLAILQSYAKRDIRIRLLSRENRGLVASLNQLIGIARGKLLARMDADDVSLPERFTLQVKFLQHHPDCVCVGGAQDWIDERGRLLIHRNAAESDAENQTLLLSGQTSINHPSAMMRRQAVLQVGGYDETLFLAEDLDLWLRLGEIGKLANLPQTVLRYRQHGRSLSEKLQTQQIRQMQTACERAWQRRGISGKCLTITPWRPCDRTSRQQYFLHYGWWFFNTRQRWAAIIYGVRAIWAWPAQIDGWKLLACALIKPLPEGELS